MKKPLTFSSSIILRDGTILPFSTMSEEEKRPYIEQMMERAGRVMSDYYAEHPERLI